MNGYEMETPKNITIKGILSLLMESIDDDKNHSRGVISLRMGDPTAFTPHMLLKKLLLMLFNLIISMVMHLQ